MSGRINFAWYNSQTLWRKGKTSPCNSCVTCKICGWKQINHAFRNTFLLLSLGGFRNYAKNCILKTAFLEMKNFKLAFYTAWKVSKYGVFSSPYFIVFGVNSVIYEVNICIQSEYGKTQTRKNSVFGHFSHSASMNSLDEYTHGMFEYIKKFFERSKTNKISNKKGFLLLYLFLRKVFVCFLEI